MKSKILKRTMAAALALTIVGGIPVAFDGNRIFQPAVTADAADEGSAVLNEETGGISVAYRGQLYQDLDEDGLRRQLTKLDPPKEEKPAVTSILRKGGGNSEG